MANTPALLPQQIPPPNTPFFAPNGDVAKVWWLYLYNLGLQVLGPASITANLEALGEFETDIPGVDAIGYAQAIANLSVPPDADPGVSSQTVSMALLMAQDGLLQDPAPLAQPERAVTVGASPFTYTATFNGWMRITGGTVSNISLARTSSYTVTGDVFPMSKGDQITVTYSGLPTMIFFTT